MGACLIEVPSTPCDNNLTCSQRSTSRLPSRSPPTSLTDVTIDHKASSSPIRFGHKNPIKLELMELENIVANTVYLKAREGESRFTCVITYCCLILDFMFIFYVLYTYIYSRKLSITRIQRAEQLKTSRIINE